MPRLFSPIWKHKRTFYIWTFSVSFADLRYALTKTLALNRFPIAMRYNQYSFLLNLFYWKSQQSCAFHIYLYRTYVHRLICQWFINITRIHLYWTSIENFVNLMKWLRDRENESHSHSKETNSRKRMKVWMTKFFPLEKSWIEMQINSFWLIFCYCDDDHHQHLYVYFHLLSEPYKNVHANE